MHMEIKYQNAHNQANRCCSAIFSDYKVVEDRDTQYSSFNLTTPHAGSTGAVQTQDRRILLEVLTNTEDIT